MKNDSSFCSDYAIDDKNFISFRKKKFQEKLFSWKGEIFLKKNINLNDTRTSRRLRCRRQEPTFTGSGFGGTRSKGTLKKIGWYRPAPWPPGHRTGGLGFLSGIDPRGRVRQCLSCVWRPVKKLKHNYWCFSTLNYVFSVIKARKTIKFQMLNCWGCKIRSIKYYNV